MWFLEGRDLFEFGFEKKKNTFASILAF